MRDAIYLALDVVRSRRVRIRGDYSEPLQKYKRDSGADVSASELPDEPEKA